jgi:hypothetical protein
MPYISASIIMQMMAVVVPSLAAMKKEGEAGRRKITQYTRYGTLGLATFQAIGASIAFQNQGVVINPGPQFVFIACVTLVTGTMFLMWLGEQVTERGIGNGISMIILAGIVAGLPSALGGTLELVRNGEMPAALALILFFLVLAVTAFVAFVERGQRRIAVNYAKRQQGRRMYQGRPPPAVQAEHGRRHSADLRVQPDPVPGDRRAVVRHRRQHGLAAGHGRQPVAGPAGLHADLRRPDHLLLLLSTRRWCSIRARRPTT